MAASLPPAVTDLTNELTNLPGIGRKSALRMALQLLKSDRETVKRLSDAIINVKDNVKVCSECGFLSEHDPCPICTDVKRDMAVLLVVEQPSDIIALEKGSIFRGRYHVLGGVLAPLDGVGPEDLRIDELVRRIKEYGIEEIIVATNPTPEGEQTAYYLAKITKPLKIKVSRIARGIPVGSDLEHADDLTLTRAIEGRGILD
ncbi:recombination mediator RecR [bacterium]|nr:recombination mediator RecR [bacterium]